VGVFGCGCALGEKVIRDGTAVSSAGSALAFLRLLRSRGHLVADLAWTQLTPCRQTLAHLFQEQGLKPGDVKSARVAYSGSAPCRQRCISRPGFGWLCPPSPFVWRR